MDLLVSSWVYAKTIANHSGGTCFQFPRNILFSLCLHGNDQVLNGEAIIYRWKMLSTSCCSAFAWLRRMVHG